MPETCLPGADTNGKSDKTVKFWIFLILFVAFSRRPGEGKDHKNRKISVGKSPFCDVSAAGSGAGEEIKNRPKDSDGLKAHWARTFSTQSHFLWGTHGHSLHILLGSLGKSFWFFQETILIHHASVSPSNAYLPHALPDGGSWCSFAGRHCVRSWQRETCRRASFLLDLVRPSLYHLLRYYYSTL